MDVMMGLIAHRVDVSEATLAKLNNKLAAGNLSITRDEARMLAKERDEALASVERVEFGTPVVVTIAEAVATSPSLTQGEVAQVLSELQAAFYVLRDELPNDVPDTEIIEALRGCLDAWGDAAEVCAMPTDEVMAFSKEYLRIAEARRQGAYLIADDEGRAYAFDPAQWDYDEQADGWDGERWADFGHD